MTLAYKAVSHDGHVVTGTIQASSREDLIASLRKQNLRPLTIVASKGDGTKKGLFAPSKKVKLQDLVIFTRQLSTMISAGVPIVRSLSALQGDSESPYMREVLASVTKDVEAGHPLADAFAKYPKFLAKST